MVSSSVRHPMRAEARAASHPAWPAPMTRTSKNCIPLSDTIFAVLFQESPFLGGHVVEFGFSLPGRGPLAGIDVVLKIAEKADALRYSSLFVTDHIVMPVSSAKSVYPYTTSGQFPGGLAQDYLEPLVLLSHLAHATARVRLGVSVLVVLYRNPLLAAKMLATTDVLSRGRVILGAGVGWLREEFEALGAPPFEERGSVTDEYLKLMRAAWTTDPVIFEGKYYTARDIHVLPKPVQRPAIPVWIGGHTGAALPPARAPRRRRPPIPQPPPAA